MDKTVEIKAKEIDLPIIDLKPYVGKDAKIEVVTTHQGEHGYYVRVATEVIDTVPGRDGEIELRASRIFGLQEDGEGNIGWGKETKLGFFLKQMKVEHYDGLVGQTVKVQVMTGKDGRKFLSFD